MGEKKFNEFQNEMPHYVSLVFGAGITSCVSEQLLVMKDSKILRPLSSSISFYLQWNIVKFIVFFSVVRSELKEDVELLILKLN